MDECEYVCSSSSGESMTDGSDTNNSFVEEVLEEDGESEIILVPRTNVCERTCGRDVDEELFGGVGYTEFFLTCVSSLKQEEIIVRSPRGRRVGVMLATIETIERDKIADIAITLVSGVNDCLVSGGLHKLPSAGQACVWSAFHQLRCSQQMKEAWSAFVSKQIPEPNQEPQLMLQLLLDRLLKGLLKNKAGAKKRSHKSTTTRPLTEIESNAIRYMAGYVAVSLLRKYRKPSKNPRLQSKRHMFVRVLMGMKAADQCGEPESVLEYTKAWSELIDRGGLYHINDKVFHLIESIEVITRRYLNVDTFTPSTDLRTTILEDVQQSELVLSHWETIACSIPSKYEAYSIELLKVITELWISVRGHSFAKEWTMKFQRSKYQKGTRKTLNQYNK